MANIFKAKTLLGRTGIFSHEAIAPNLVYNTGNQTISGIKTFAENAVFGDPSQGDFLVISGNTFTIYGSGNFTSGLFVNGNPVLTGVNLSSYATTANLALTGSTLDTKINNLSGVSVLTFGDQNISGNKNFLNNLGVSGTGFFSAIDLNNIDTLSLSGVDITITSGVVTLTNPVSAPNLVYNTGDQTINGLKTFTSSIDIYSGTSPQSLRIFNSTGTNSGEFGLIGWRNNQFVIGSQQSQSGILRDVVITGNNININGSGVLNIFDNTNIVGNLTVTGNTTITSHLSAASKSFLIDHPTQVGKKLQYGSLEGPEHGVFVRGKTNDNIINLPNYWPALVDENSISVNLTPINVYSNIYVVDYNNSRITTNGNNGNYYFYTIYGERKDIPKLTVEF